MTPRSLMWPGLAAALVAAAHTATVRLDAWLPLPAWASGEPDGLVVLSTGAVWLATIAELPAWGLVGLPWPVRLVLVALAATSVATFLVARASARLGLPAIVGGLLALVAAGGPLMWAQATTPTGTSLLTALSASLLLLLTPGPMRRRTLVAALVIGLTGLVLASVVPSGEWGRTGSAVTIIGKDLGRAGLVLSAVGLLNPLAAGPLVAGVLALGVTAPLGTAAQAAAGLPAAWALVACGIGTLLEWRGGPFTRARLAWLTIAVSAWAGVQAAGRPWVARAESTRMSAFWAGSVAEAVGTSAIVQDGSAATTALLNAWLHEQPSGARLTLQEAQTRGADAALSFLAPEVVDRAPWMGLPPSDAPAALATLSDLIGDLPPGIVVVAGIGEEAAASLTADDWHALGGLGSRMSGAGQPRARALMSVTGGRQRGVEVVTAGRAVLERLPGDPIGTTGHPSPLDVRLDVSARDIALIERDRLRASARDTLLGLYRRDGTLLGLWVGAGGRYLGSGLPGTLGPVIRRVDDVLPCRVVAADAEVDLEALALNGALGVEAPSGARITIATTWQDGGPDGYARRVGEPAGASPPAADASTLVVTDTRPFGLDLRGRPAGVNWRADAVARVCAAAPLAPVVPLPDGGDVPVHPTTEAAFGRGWHDMEPLGGGQYFRWSSGRAASLLWTLSAAPRPDATITLTLDLQNAGVPRPHDLLQVTVNGTGLASQPVAEGRRPYSWTIPGAALRAGLNEVRLETTLTVRPSAQQPGADGRLLGVALHGWQVRCEC